MLTDVSSQSVAAILPLYVTGAMGLTTIAYALIDVLYQGFRAFLLAAYAFRALPFGGAVVTAACLLVFGCFYASTDGVLAALARQFSPEGTTASGISATQTVVAVACLLASTRFGMLRFSPGHLNAMVIVASALAVAIPAVFLLLRLLFPPRGRHVPGAAHHRRGNHRDPSRRRDRLRGGRVHQLRTPPEQSGRTAG